MPAMSRAEGLLLLANRGAGQITDCSPHPDTLGGAQDSRGMTLFSLS